jgi:hypothetical protein
MAIKDIQRRQAEVGRIRIGNSEDTGRTNKHGAPIRRPAKLEAFRFTSPSKTLIEQVAAVYGGTPAQWQPQGGGAPQWEVYTTADSLPVVVPPNAVSQWYETWAGGMCVLRCDGEREVLRDRPCQCPADPGDRRCKPTTRVSLMLDGQPGAGLWRLETHGYYAATELPAMAELLALAGGYVAGRLELDERSARREKADGTGVETRRWMVPVLHVDATPGELLALAGGGRESVGSNGSRPALEAPSPDFYALANEARSVETVRALWAQAARSGRLDDRLKGHLNARAADLTPEQPEASADVTPKIWGDVDWLDLIAHAGDVTALRTLWDQMNAVAPPDPALKQAWWARKKELETAPPDDFVPSEPEPDRDDEWTRVLSLAGERGWTTSQTSALMRETIGKDAGAATGWDFRRFADAINEGTVG